MNKGFTLIELLAVIVILAIIAVIAVPIVLNIIDESKDNATLRSAEMYMDAVELSIANRVMHHGSIDNGRYPIMSDGDICLGEYNTNVTPKTCANKPIDSTNENVLKVEVKGEKPTSGQIVIKNGQIDKAHNTTNKTWLVISEKKIEPKEENGEVKFGIVDSKNNAEEIIEVGKMSICKPLSVQVEGTYTVGDKYECDVDPNKEGYDYTFYVLNSTSTEVNLIMDRNICSDGTPTNADKNDKCGVIWDSGENSKPAEIPGTTNSNGPKTAMEYLNSATSSWDNINNLNITYDDEGGRFTGFVITSKARMPYQSEISDLNDTNKYLYENLAYIDYSSEGGPIYGVNGVNHISGIDGYWLLSSAGVPWDVLYIGFQGYMGSTGFDSSSGSYGGVVGVRPVITLKI